MERLAQLIGKLNEQFAQNADPFQLLVTTQLIETELVQMSTSTHRTVNSSKVAVMMPAANGHGYPNRHVNNYVNNDKKADEIKTQAVVNTPVAVVEAPIVVEAPTVVAAPVVVETQPLVNGTVNGTNGIVDKNNGHHPEPEQAEPVEYGYKFDPLREIPTLAHQHAVKELNEVMASKDASLNEKLKEEVKEVAHVLNDAPVRDLRRAIGINDRFVFISELFRNDEVMYERSIKTINSFRILPEAQYWIERELKVKLGWDENKESTRHFYQLVKRRFS